MLGLLGLTFTACSNGDDVVADAREDGKVRVTLSLGRTEASKSVGATAQDKYNTVTDLKVVFYNAAGAFVAYPSDGTIGDTPYDNDKAIQDAVAALNSASSHETTIELKGIPSSATQMLIVANSNGKSNGITTTSLVEAKKTQIYLKQQFKIPFTTFSGEESRMTGLGQIKSGADNTATVTVQLKPVPSRIEMAKVTAQPLPANETWGGAQIKSFTVVGFYVNRFYPTGSLDPTMDETGRQRVDFGMNSKNYDASYYGSKEVDWGMMCDEIADGQMTYAANSEENPLPYTATPTTATNWWGYQVLQGTTSDVVVKLNVTYDDDTTAPKFLTITKYTYATAFGDHLANSQVEEFLRGHVYKINEIKFNVLDLTDVPYEETKALTATVTVEPWVGVGVEAGFN